MAAAGKVKLRVLRAEEFPTDDAASAAAMLELARVANRWTEMSTRLVRKHGLTLPHFEVLICLVHGEGISQQDLSDRLMFTKGNICVILQKMEAAGQVDRRVDPIDQRVHRLYLTTAGRKLVAAIIPEHRDAANRILETFSATDRQHLHRMMTRIGQAFDDQGEA